MEESKLVAKKRDGRGSSEARRLRKTGGLPAVIYSDGEAAIPVQLDMHTVEELIHHHSSESMMVNIEVDGETQFPVLVKDVQHNAVTGGLLHVDLYKVSMDRRISVEVPVEVVGTAEGVKEGGLLEVLMHSILVECLPADLLDVVKVDVSEMKIGDTLTVDDIKLDLEKYTLLMDGEASVVAVSAPRVEVAGSEEGEAGAEPEVIKEKKKEASE